MKNLVKEQYENYIYPLPVDSLEPIDGKITIETMDPIYLRRKYWPKKNEPENLNILIAGCGSNQAARIAFNNPNCKVLGIDISKASLENQAALKNRHELNNLQLELLPIEELHNLDRKFDLIISTGVLHHLNDPIFGLKVLSSVLEENGVISLMLYAKYGRIGVYMMQELFKIIETKQNPQGIDLVKQALEVLPKNHHLHSLLNNIDDLEYDAGIVDLFLHPQDRSYSVPEVLEFAEKASLIFRGWLDNADYSINNINLTSSLYAKLSELPNEKRWAAAELLTHAQSKHNFILCKKESFSWSLDFSGDQLNSTWLAYKPSVRRPIEVLRSISKPDSPPAILRRLNRVFELSFIEARLFEQCNGDKSIKEIILSIPLGNATEVDVISKSREFFTQMHDLDHLLFEIP
jgi:SAM-dependent methyltransferase